ncbi:MAG: T9SS type A sorting domain-containing protein [Hymenobacteraceae bacterium]|nr:T9SS type A sorting domain-containing protein [Hymenobacteraceae bacterium]
MHSLSTFSRWLLAGLALLARPATAQTLDRTFQRVDVRASDPEHYILGNSLVRDSQGRVVIGGQFDFLAGQPVGNVTRLLPTGARDLTFNPGGAGANGSVLQVLRQPGGKWIIAGFFTRYNGQPAQQLARLHPDGALDTTFRAEFRLDEVIQHVRLDAQGRLVMLKYERDINRHWFPRLIRLLPDGARDASFQAANTLGADSMITALAVDGADRILVSHFAPYARNLERLLPSGALDTTFNVAQAGQPGLAGGWVTYLKPLANGQLVVVVYGGSASYNGDPLPYVFKLNADATPDPTFTCAVDGSRVHVVEESAGGLLVAGGELSTFPRSTSANVLRLRANGSVDGTFVGPSLPPRPNLSQPGDVNDLVVDAAGQLLLAGRFQQVWGHPTVGFGRLLPSGAVDPSFTNASLDGYAGVFGLVRQSGDRLLVTGYFRKVNGQPAPGITRFLADGALDASFQPDSTLANATASRRPFLIDGADRILAMAMNTGQIARFQPNGQLDPGFQLGSGPVGAGRSEVAAMAVYPDGRVLAGGEFSTYNGVPRHSLVRLLATGAVDPSFLLPASFETNFVLQVVRLPDGSVAALTSLAGGGPFLPPPVGSNYGLYWLDAAGQPLPGFNGGRPDTLIVGVLAVLPDTTLLVVRSNPVTGESDVRKLTRTGAFDPAFVIDPALGTTQFSVVLQPDGKLLVMGEFPPYQYGTLRRLTSDGALDPTFVLPEIGAETGVRVLFQSTGKLVIGGYFTTVDGVPYPTLARLENVVTGLAAPQGSARAAFDVFPNPAHAAFTLRRPTAEPATATLVDVLGRPLRRWTLTAAETRLPLGGVAAGAYVLRVVSAQRVTTRTVVVE